MADAQSVGEQPSASAQNAYNADTYDFESVNSHKHRFGSSSGWGWSGTLYVRSRRTTTYSDLVNVHMYLAKAWEESDLYFYNSADEEVLHIYGTSNHSGGGVQYSITDPAYVTYDSRVNDDDDVDFYFYFEPGEYSWTYSDDADWNRVTYTNQFHLYAKRGQTDIPAYTETEWGGGTRTVSPWLRIWAEDFSQLESIQPREDTTDTGISIEYHTTCRAGYDEDTEY